MRPRAGLDRASVVQAAANLADAAGSEITLAALAEHLKVRTPSLYNHISGQDGLRRELALLGLAKLGRRLAMAAVGKTADDAIEAIAHAYRQFAQEHPGVYPATQRAPDPADTELAAAADAVVEVLTLVMASYGLRDAAAIHAIRGLRAMLHGFVTLEAAGGFGIPLDLDESFDRAMQVFIVGLRGEDDGTDNQ